MGLASSFQGADRVFSRMTFDVAAAAITRTARGTMAENPSTPPDMEKAPRLDSIGHPQEAIIKHANDADEAMKAFEGYEGEILVLDEATSKKLLRKIDWHLMPVSASRCLARQSVLTKAIAALCHLWPQLLGQ